MAKTAACSQPKRACFSDSENKTEGKKDHKHAVNEDGCSEGPSKHLQEGNSEWGHFHGLQTSGRHGLYRIMDPYRIMDRTGFICVLKMMAAFTVRNFIQILLYEGKII